MNFCCFFLVKLVVFVFVLGFVRFEKKFYVYIMRLFGDLFLFDFMFVCLFCLLLFVLF